MDHKTYSFEENPARSLSGGRLAGVVLDKYEIVRKVGEGGMATVYLARHVTLGREVALKVLHPHLSVSTRNRRRFAREARAIEHLEHDNILRIFDYSGVDVEDCYIVTEYVRGRTLQALLDERGLLPSEVCALVGLRLAEALAYAHATGIIHRDLKPENVMLREDGVVKLMDFGIARFLDESTVTMTGALVGSPAYMSPEQALERPIDPRSDLFSLGTVLFHLVTGQMPFAGSNPSVILRNIIEGARAEVLELQPGASPQLADVIERLLQPDPADRYVDASAVVAALAGVLAAAEVSEADPAWSLAAYVDAPDDYEARLGRHLDAVLLRKGREAFGAGDHLGAQRLLNRLLVAEPDHPEVLELLTSLHQPMEGAVDAPPRLAPVALGVAALLLLAGLAWVQLAPEPPPPPAEAVVEAVAAPTPPPAPALFDEPPTSPIEQDELPLLREPVAAPRALQPEVLAPVASRIRAASPPAEPEPAPPEPELARVTVRVTDNVWADAFLDGELVGRVRQPRTFELPPGPHVLTLTNVVAKDHVTRFEVAAGETREIEVTLVKKPISVRFGPPLSPACALSVDGEPAGTLAELGGRFDLADPDVRHQLDLSCGEGEPLRFTVDPGRPGSRVLLPPSP